MFWEITKMSNCAFVSRVFQIPFAGFKKGKVLVEHTRLTSSITRQNLYQIPTSLMHQLTVLPTNNACLSLRALKHTSKFSRGKGEKVVDEDEEDDEDTSSTDISALDSDILSDVDDKDIKIIKKKLNSLRLDTLLKAGLGIAKNKIDTAFYESKIRVNGDKLLKKSTRLEIGDEVDLIKGPNVMNPAFLDVGRVIILKADYTPDLEKVLVLLKRYRSLTIENYANPYKAGAE